jgi:murein DD-endopeptidase MepM/ murein hydrolase activator NlpD
MSESLILPPLPITLTDRMASEQAAVQLSPVKRSLYYTAVLGQGVGISSLARRYGLSLGTLLSVNQLAHVDDAQHLEVLKMPFMDGLMVNLHKERKLSALAKQYRVEESLLRSANYLASDLQVISGLVFIPELQMSNAKLKRMIGNALLYPVFGSIKEGFGSNTDTLTGLERHEMGVLFQTTAQNTVYFAADGVVLEVGYQPKLGNYVVVQHQEYIALYGKLATASSYRVDDLVQQSQEVAKVMVQGSQGQFYFSLLKNGLPIDPIPLLR